MTPLILVLGGSGTVGRHVSRLLAGADRHVLVGGRSPRALRTAVAGLVNAAPFVVDVRESDAAWPRGVSLVIDCTGTDLPGTARKAALLAANHVDISASSRHLARLEAMGPLFKNAGLRCLIGVGLAPGLTTILATSIHDHEDPEPIELHGLLDVRDEHGPESAAFTTGLVGQDFIDPVTHNAVRNFSGLRRIHFPAGFARQLVARADFPDQYTLTRELGVAVTTNYGFTNPAITIAMSLASRFPRVGVPLLRQVTRLPRPTGSGSWLMMASTQSRCAWATGNGQSKDTAVICAMAVERMLADRAGAGTVYLHHLLRLEEGLVSELSSHRIVVETASHGLEDGPDGLSLWRRR